MSDSTPDKTGADRELKLAQRGSESWWYASVAPNKATARIADSGTAWKQPTSTTMGWRTAGFAWQTGERRGKCRQWKQHPFIKVELLQFFFGQLVAQFVLGLLEAPFGEAAQRRQQLAFGMSTAVGESRSSARPIAASLRSSLGSTRTKKSSTLPPRR